MPTIRFNITTNFKGTQYRAGDEATLTEKEIKLFDGAGGSGMPHIIRLKGKEDAKKDDSLGPT